MNDQQFSDWLHTGQHCEESQEWFDSLPEQTIEYAWDNCERGDWMLDCLAKAGVPFETLAPVAYAAVNRAMEYAGVKTVEVVDAETAAEAAWAARVAARAAARAAAWAAEAAGAARAAAWAAEAAAWAVEWEAELEAEREAAAAGAATRAAAGAAAWEAGAEEGTAELKQSADAVRAMIPISVLIEALQEQNE